MVKILEIRQKNQYLLLELPKNSSDVTGDDIASRRDAKKPYVLHFNVKIVDVDDEATAEDVSVSGDEGSNITFDLNGVDVDSAVANLRYKIVDIPAGFVGELKDTGNNALLANGSVLTGKEIKWFAPTNDAVGNTAADKDWYGYQSFTYQVTDDIAADGTVTFPTLSEANKGTVTITVSNVNDIPVVSARTIPSVNEWSGSNSPPDVYVNSPRVLHMISLENMIFMTQIMKLLVEVLQM